MKLGLVGAGTMGANHARVIAAADATLAFVVDHDQEKADELAAAYGAEATSSIENLAKCDGAIVATTTPTHARIAEDLLALGVPLLVEKPLAVLSADAERIVSLSRDRGVPIMCGFVERFNPAVQEARELLDGPPLHVFAVRHSPKPERTMGSVVQDVAIHDIDLSLLFCGTSVRAVNAFGWAPEGGQPMEIVDASIVFDSGAIATISANRWTQRKIRALSVSTDSRLLEIDMLRQTVTVYRHVQHEMLTGAGYRAETVVDIPFVRHSGEPLALQLLHFIRLIRGEADPEGEREGLLASHLVAQGIEDHAVEALA